MTQPRNWRACVNHWIVWHAKQLGITGVRETGWSQLPAPVLKVIAPLADELEKAALAAHSEHRRTDLAIERIINRRIWNALTPFSPKRFGAYEQLDFDPYANRKSTLDWCARIDREHDAAAAAASHQLRNAG